MADEDEIKEAKTTDVYFLHTKEILVKNHIDSEVVMEVFVRDLLPYQGIWGVLTGTYEVAKLLEGLPIDVWSLPEGSVFLADAKSTMYEPLMTIVGRYRDFVEYENPVLGLLSSFTCVSTRAARFRVAAGDKSLLSFGTRRVHPAISPVVERNCYLAGFDKVSNVLGGRLLGVEPAGTMPHALVQIIGDQAKAWMLFDKTVSKKVQRTALVDTFWDEKTESIEAFRTLGKNLWAVRLDTPSSRRGDFRKIVEEVRWELDIRGGQGVKIIVSGRLSEQDMAELGGLVDGFGVGTSVAYPPVIDFSAKIVDVKVDGEWQHRAKRGGLGGRKSVSRSRGYKDLVTLEGKSLPSGYETLLRPLMKQGRIVEPFKSIEELRSYSLKEIRSVAAAEPSLTWR